MKISFKISKRFLVQLLLVATLGTVALVCDLYFENHPEALAEIQSEAGEPEDDRTGIYLFSQNSNPTFKSSVQKASFRKLQIQKHDRFLQKCHQRLNHQVLKTDLSKPRNPGVLTCHFLIFRHHLYSGADDVPLIS